jgi:hypothetical protein
MPLAHSLSTSHGAPNMRPDPLLLDELPMPLLAELEDASPIPPVPPMPPEEPDEVLDPTVRSGAHAGMRRTKDKATRGVGMQSVDID